MAINILVLNNGGLLPDILLLTQAPFCVWFDGTSNVVYYYYPLNYVLHCSLLCYFWWLYMVINIIPCRDFVFIAYETVYYYAMFDPRHFSVGPSPYLCMVR